MTEIIVIIALIAQSAFNYFLFLKTLGNMHANSIKEFAKALKEETKPPPQKEPIPPIPGTYASPTEFFESIFGKGTVSMVEVTRGEHKKATPENIFEAATTCRDKGCISQENYQAICKLIDEQKIDEALKLYSDSHPKPFSKPSEE